MSDSSGTAQALTPDNPEPQDHSYLVGLYQAERSDLTALYLASIAVLAFGTTIAAAALGLIVTVESLSPVVPLVIPLAISTVILYNAIVAALAKTRAVSALKIEVEILGSYSSPLLPYKEDLLVGIGDRVLDLKKGPLFGIANVLCNAVIVLSGISFVIFCLIHAAEHDAKLAWLILSAALNGSMLLYAAVLLVKGHLTSALTPKFG